MKRFLLLLGCLFLFSEVIIGQSVLSFADENPFMLRIFKSPVRAIIFFVSCFSFLQFLQNKDWSFFFYTIYLLFLFISFIYIINNDLGDNKDLLLPSYEKLKLFLSPLMILSYFFFVISILDLKKKSKKAYQTILLACFSIGVYFILLIFNALFFHLISSANILRGAIFITILVCGSLLFYIPSLWRTKEKVDRFIIVGSSFILLGFVITSLSLLEADKEGEYFFTLLSPYLGSAKSNDFIILQLTSLIEILCFSSALGAKSKQNELRIRATERTLYSIQLKQKDQKVSEQALELERQRVLQLETQFQKKIAQAESKALKAQMNPHFMFNCLNSFKYLIQKKDTDRAEKYLIKFSQLLRGIVENSQKGKILLNEELEVSKLYIEMESLRFDDSFHFEINILSQFDLSFVEVPPFIFQPFIENSIWHGLLRKKGEKNLVLNISLENDIVKCSIRDNGIGLKASLAKKKMIHQKMKLSSVGMSNTDERIHLFGEMYDVFINTQILEHFDENENSLGVEVIINIPM